MNYSQYLCRLALAIAVVVAVPVALILFIDPYHIFHKPFISGLQFSNQQRYQNAGLIRSYLADPQEGYDSVLLGTSMSYSATPEAISKAFGWNKALPLIIHGGRPVELEAQLSFLLTRKTIKHVLWELHPMFHLWPHESSETEAFFPAFLYNSNPLDDGPYVFNWDTLKISWQLLHGVNKNHWWPISEVGLMYPPTFASTQRALINAKEGLDSIRPNSSYHLDTPAKELQHLQYPQLEKHVYPILKQYCNNDVEFVLFIAPWPTYFFLNQTSASYQNIYAPRHILKHISGCANIRLHAFDLLPMAGDMNYYVDDKHYGFEFNDYLMERMGRREYELTRDNVGQYEQKLIQHINHYQLYSSYPAPLVF